MQYPNGGLIHMEADVGLKVLGLIHHWFMEFEFLECLMDNEWKSLTKI